MILRSVRLFLNDDIGKIKQCSLINRSGEWLAGSYCSAVCCTDSPVSTRSMTVTASALVMAEYGLK